MDCSWTFVTFVIQHYYLLCSCDKTCILQICMCNRYFAMVCHCRWLTMILYETVYQSTVIGSAVYLPNLNAVCLFQYSRHQMNTYLPYWIIYTMSLYHVLMAVSAYYFYCYRCYVSRFVCSLQSSCSLCLCATCCGWSHNEFVLFVCACIRASMCASWNIVNMIFCRVFGTFSPNCQWCIMWAEMNTSQFVVVTGR